MGNVAGLGKYVIGAVLEVSIAAIYSLFMPVPLTFQGPATRAWNVSFFVLCNDVVTRSMLLVVALLPRVSSRSKLRLKPMEWLGSVKENVKSRLNHACDAASFVP